MLSFPIFDLSNMLSCTHMVPLYLCEDGLHTIMKFADYTIVRSVLLWLGLNWQLLCSIYLLLLSFKISSFPKCMVAVKFATKHACHFSLWAKTNGTILFGIEEASIDLW